MSSPKRNYSGDIEQRKLAALRLEWAVNVLGTVSDPAPQANNSFILPMMPYITQHLIVQILKYNIVGIINSSHSIHALSQQPNLWKYGNLR